jgi:hypothetical protein
MATVRGHYRFTVKERSVGSPWLAESQRATSFPAWETLALILTTAQR